MREREGGRGREREGGTEGGRERERAVVSQEDLMKHTDISMEQVIPGPIYMGHKCRNVQNGL
jgi:hypothetical protein